MTDEPFAVWDVRIGEPGGDDAYYADQQARMNAWAEREGVNLHHTVRMEFHRRADGGLIVRLTDCELDEHDVRVVNGNEFVYLPPRDVPVSSVPDVDPFVPRVSADNLRGSDGPTN